MEELSIRVRNALSMSVRHEWMLNCLYSLENHHGAAAFSSFSFENLRKKVEEQINHSDIRDVCDGCLPSNITQLHKVKAPGPFFLQIDEVVDIANPHDNRVENKDEEKKQKSPRCFKFNLSDGKTSVFAFELRNISSILTNVRAGMKIWVQNVLVHHGILLLIPENVNVVGGFVPSLEEVRSVLDIPKVGDKKEDKGNGRQTGVLEDIEELDADELERAIGPLTADMPPSGGSERITKKRKIFDISDEEKDNELLLDFEV